MFIDIHFKSGKHLHFEFVTNFNLVDCKIIIWFVKHKPLEFFIGNIKEFFVARTRY